MKKKSVIILTIILIAIIVVSACFIIQKVQEKNRSYEIETITEYKYFVVKENSKYGVIDGQGNKIIEAQYDDIKIPNPEKSVFICYEGENAKVLNQNSEEIFTKYENIEPLRLKNISSDLMYEKSVLKYQKNSKYGIIDLNGKKITSPIYDEIDTLQFKEGELLVKKDGKYGVINIKGAILVKTQYDKIEVDKFYEQANAYKNAGYIVTKTTEEGYRYGYVNLEGKEIVETKYNDLYRVTEVNGNDIYIICAENGRYGLLKNGKQIIDNEYQSLLYNESNDTITTLKGKKYGVFSNSGKLIIPFEYKQIDITGKNIYATATDENIKTFDENGKETNMSPDLAIIDLENTEYKIYIETIDGKTRYSVCKNGKQVTQKDYTYIQYLYDNYFIACDTNGKLGIIDENENTKIDFNYNSIHQIENTKMIETLNNNTEVTQIYSSQMEKICELKNAIIENNIEYIKIYNNEESKYVKIKNNKKVKKNKR